MSDSKLSDGGRNEEPIFLQESGEYSCQYCQPCKNKQSTSTAEFFCIECNEYQCSDCSNIHTYFSFTKNHKIVKISETNEHVNNMKLLEQCEEHQEVFQYFCEGENELCCSKCIIGGHRQCHGIVEVKDKAFRQFSVLDLLKNPLEKITETVKRILNSISINKSKMNADASDVLKQIQEMQDETNRVFENLKSTVRVDLASFQKKATIKLNIKETHCKEYLTEVEIAQSSINAAKEHGSPVQQFIISQNLKNLVTKLKAKTTKEYDELEDTLIAFEFDKTLALPPTHLVLPGKLTTNIVIPLEGRCVNHNVTQIKPIPLASVNLKQDEDNTKAPCYRSLDILPDGKLVAIDNGNTKCVILNQKLKQVGSYTFSEIKPIDVAVVFENEIAITNGGGQKLTFLQINSDNEISELRTITVKGFYSSIYSMSDGNILLGTYDDCQPIRVISAEGEEKELGINFPKKSYQIDCSCVTFVKGKNKVVLTDRLEHTVFIFDIINNTTIEVKDKIIQEPFGVVAGPDDTILVCCRLTNSIVQISDMGMILSSYKLPNMWYPSHIAISHDKHIIAVSNRTVSVGFLKIQLFII